MSEEGHDAAVALLSAVARRTRLAPTKIADAEAAWTLVEESGSLERLAPSLPRLLRSLRHVRETTLTARILETATDGSAESSPLFRLERATCRLSDGQEQPADLLDAVRGVLAEADQHFKAARFAEAAELALWVSEAVFHRELHAEVMRSPLASDTESFLGPLRESLTYTALSSPAGSMAEAVSSAGAGSADVELPPATTATGPEQVQPSFLRRLAGSADSRRGAIIRRLMGRTVPRAQGATAPRPPTSQIPKFTETGSAAGARVLFLSGGNLHFTTGLIEDLAGPGGAQVRTARLREGGPAFARRGHLEMIADRLAEAAGQDVPALPAEGVDFLAWPETVFVDWCDTAAQWAALHVPRDKRLVIRVHSLEAISHQPHMIDWSRVSDLIFVGGHIRDLFLAAVPAAATSRVHVIPNEIQLQRFGLPKVETADRTIAMVGWGHQVKDPIWALDVLAALRETDDRWRLLLIGRDFAESQYASGYRYRDMFRERAQRADVRDGVVEVGYTTDLPGVLTQAGFAICSSRREGAPVGITEAAASGAVPVVRDWPMVKPLGGAHRVFPADWIVESVDEAVARIRVLAEADEWRSVGTAAREHALATFDWTVVAPQYRELFFGVESDRR